MKPKVRIVSKITSSQENNHNKLSYHAAHHAGNLAEIKDFGQKQFDYINHKIQQLPKNHWAGTHDQKRTVLISQEFLDLIPKSKRISVKKEIIDHEKTEQKIMKRKR